MSAASLFCSAFILFSPSLPSSLPSHLAQEHVYAGLSDAPVSGPRVAHSQDTAVGTYCTHSPGKQAGGTAMFLNAPWNAM